MKADVFLRTLLLLQTKVVIVVGKISNNKNMFYIQKKHKIVH